MATKVYGASDDLIEFDGDFRGECGGGGSEPGDLVILSDGSLLLVKYGKPALGSVWMVSALKKGALFDRIETCEDEDATIYSDVAYFKDGIKWAYHATHWFKVD